MSETSKPTPTASAAFRALQRDPGWPDWRWQMRQAARTPATLRGWFRGGTSHPAADAVAERFPVAVTPYYASRIRRADRRDPVWRLCAPDAAELRDAGAAADPFHEEEAMPVPGMIRRYRDRALILATRRCAAYCRHCTRKHVVGRAGAAPDLPAITRYLRAHPGIREVLVSGGDPLILSTARLDAILCAARAAPNVEIVRIGTRVPVVLPQRVTPELVRMLKGHHPLWINTHFNHPAELSGEAADACARLADAGIPMGNQTVLLRGINDRVAVLEELFRGLLRCRVRPYYLLQCDPVRGVGHFRVPLQRGLAIMDALRSRLTGLAVPQFVVDVPAGGGKVPLLPSGIVSHAPGAAVLRGPGGRRFRVPDA